jgi:hypothetical protein
MTLGKLVKRWLEEHPMGTFSLESSSEKEALEDDLLTQ